MKLDEPKGSQDMKTNENEQICTFSHVLPKRHIYLKYLQFAYVHVDRLREEKCGEEIGFVTLDP